MPVKTFSFILLTTLLIGTLDLSAFQRQQTLLSKAVTEKYIDNYISQVSDLMSRDKYDSAYNVLSGALDFSDSTNYRKGKYYLYAFQCEILYYNSLFGQALNSGLRALRIAEEIGNDTLIGSIENLIGLQLSNMNQYDLSEKYFRSALAKIPLIHGNENLSYRFHAASNLCGVFLSKNAIDSALFYARVSLQEATLLGKQRAIAIDYWNIAKAHLSLSNYDSVAHYVEMGRVVASENSIDDVQLFFIPLKAEYLMHKGRKHEGIQLIENGLNNIQSNVNLTRFSIIDFLTEAVRLLMASDEFLLAAKVQVMLTTIKNKTDDIRNKEQITVLQRFYENEKRLELLEAMRNKTMLEAKLNRFVFIGIIALIILMVVIVGLFVNGYLQRQNIRAMELERENEIIALQKEKEIIQERVDSANLERNRIAKELHDDVGSSLSGISLYSDVALKELETNPVRSKELLQKLNQKSKELAEKMSDIIWAVYSKNDNLSNLIMRMKNFAFEMVAPLNIEIMFQYSFELDDLVLNSEQRKSVYFIFKETINNSIKHSGCSRIDIVIESLENGELQMTIKDNGSGYNPDLVKKNNGFYTLQSRARLIGGVTTINSEPGGGAVVSVRFPIKLTEENQS